MTVTDFGRQHHGRPAMTFQPRNVDEVAAAVRAAVTAGLGTVVRGRGHSVDGQTVAHGSALIDMSQMRRVLTTGANDVTVEAGATWRDLLNVTLPNGLSPRVVPDYLDLTVGGTAVMGGICGVSHLYGTVADQVVQALIVDEGGPRTVTAGADLDRCLAGAGRDLAVVTLTLRLGPVPRLLRRTNILTHDLDDHLDIQRGLILARSDHLLDGSARPVSSGWEFSTHVAYPHNDTGQGLHMDRTRGLSTVKEFLGRIDPAVNDQKNEGTWFAAPHPRLQTIVPLAPGRALVREVLAEEARRGDTPPPALTLYVTRAEPLRRLQVAGDDEGLALVTGWQRTAAREDSAQLQAMQDANERIIARVVAVEGTLYPARRPTVPGPQRQSREDQ